MRNDLAALLHEYIINLPPGLVQRDIHPFARVAMHWKKKEYLDLSGINVNHRGSKMTLWLQWGL